MSSEQQVTLRIKGDASGLQQAARTAGDSLERIGPAGEQSGRQVAGAMNQAERETSKLARVAGTLAASLGAGITALSAITKSAIDNADATRKMAQMIGISVAEFSTLQFAADQSGIAVESLREGLTRLSANAADAARGVGNAKDAFAALGISVTHADGTLRTSREILGSVAERFAEIEDGVGKTALAVDIFGRSGAQLIPMLNAGADGLEALEQRARDLGLELSDNTAAQAEQFNDLVAQLSDLSRGLGNDIARELLPSLVAYTSQMVDAGIETRKSTGFIEGFATILRGIIATLETARRGVEAITNGLAALVDIAIAAARAGTDVITAYTPMRLFAGLMGREVKTASQIVEDFANTTRAAADSAGVGFRGAVNALSRAFEALFSPAVAEAAGGQRELKKTNDAVADALRALSSAQSEQIAKLQQQIATYGKGRVALVEYQRSLELAKASEIADAEARERYIAGVNEQFDKTAALARQLDALTSANRTTKQSTQESERALREQAKAAQEAAIALGSIDSILDATAAQLGGQSVRAAQDLRDALIELAQAEAVLAAQGLVTEDVSRRIQITREELVRAYQQATEDIAASERQLTDRSIETVSDWERTWLQGIDAVSFAFGDWLSGSLGSFRNFGRELLRIGQRIVADLIAQFARTRLLQGLGLAGGAGASGAAFAGTGAAAGFGSLAGGITQGGGLLGGLLGSTFGAAGGLLSGLGGALGGFGAGLTVAGNAGLLAATQFGAASIAAGNLAVGIGSLVPVIGTVAAVASAINSLTGGRLFGTSWRSTGVGGIDVSFGQGGASGSGFEEQSRRRSLFRGTARRTVSTPLDARAQQQLDDAFAQIENAVIAAAAALRTEVPPIVAGAWREVRDSAGNVISQTSTVLGRTFTESFEDFQRRLTAENILAVIDRALGSTVEAAAQATGDQIGDAIGDALKPIGPEVGGLVKSLADAGVSVSAIAERWRGNAEDLLDGAQFLLTAAADIQRGAGLLGGAESLPALADLIEDLAAPTESLSQAYQRAATATALLDRALIMSGITVDRTREAVVRFAVDIAEAAGGLDQAAALWSRYFDVAFSAEERLTAALAQAEQARDALLSGAGLDAGSTLADIRAAIESLLASGGDPERIVALLRAADAVATVNEILAEIASLAPPAADAIGDVADELARLAEIDSIMREVFDALDALEMSDFAREIQRIRRAEAERIATLTALGASESQLAAVRRLATLETQSAIAGLRASIASLRDQLQGTPLSRIEEQIRQFQAGQVGAIQSVGAAAESMWGNQVAHVQRIDDYLRSLLTGPNSLLTPRQRVDAAMQDYRETLRLAQLGDADALGRITQVADVALRELRSYFGSSGPTQDFFAQLQRDLSALRGVGAVGGPVAGGGAVGGGGPAPVPPELAALLAERDRLIAEQQARERLSLATTLAQQLGELADALQRPFEELAAELGIDLESLARDLGIDPDGIAALIERLTTTRVAESQLAALEGLGDVQLAALNETVTQTGILESIRDGIERLTPVDLPSFDVGSGGVPRTGLAQVHRGEIILPPAVSEFARRSGLSIGAGGGGNGGAVEARLAELIQATREASERQERRLERLEAATVGSGDRITRTLESSGSRRM